jgi:hypothetical protein
MYTRQYIQSRLSTVGFALFLIATAAVTLSLSLSQSRSRIATDDQSVCLSWFRAPAGTHDQMFLLV